ncbi:hypothetical protein [Phenylobacterium sp.]|jgi:hypothetical protein
MTDAERRDIHELARVFDHEARESLTNIAGSPRFWPIRKRR